MESVDGSHFANLQSTIHIMKTPSALLSTFMKKKYSFANIMNADC
jgi:hypothetical protein